VDTKVARTIRKNADVRGRQLVAGHGPSMRDMLRLLLRAQPTFDFEVCLMRDAVPIVSVL
jgi:hypothetical protein